MQAIEESLRALRDVQGVHGSFVITISGALVARDLPSAFDNQLFAEVGPRVARLYETFLSGGEEMDACVLRYSEHKLYLRKTAVALLGVLSGIGVNMPALRMVSNLVIRRVDPVIAAFTKTAPTGEAGPSADAAPPLPPTLAVAVPPPAVEVVPGATAAAAATPPAPLSSNPWVLESEPTAGDRPRPSVVPEDGRDPPASPGERHVRMYRGRRVDQ